MISNLMQSGHMEWMDWVYSSLFSVKALRADRFHRRSFAAAFNPLRRSIELGRWTLAYSAKKVWSGFGTVPLLLLLLLKCSQGHKIRGRGRLSTTLCSSGLFVDYQIPINLSAYNHLWTCEVLITYKSPWGHLRKTPLFHVLILSVDRQSDTR